MYLYLVVLTTQNTKKMNTYNKEEQLACKKVFLESLANVEAFSLREQSRDELLAALLRLNNVQTTILTALLSPGPGTVVHLMSVDHQ
jgi:hypothetical protein